MSWIENQTVNPIHSLNNIKKRQKIEMTLLGWFNEMRLFSLTWKEHLHQLQCPFNTPTRKNCSSEENFLFFFYWFRNLHSNGLPIALILKASFRSDYSFQFFYSHSNPSVRYQGSVSPQGRTKTGVEVAKCSEREYLKRLEAEALCPPGKWTLSTPFLTNFWYGNLYCCIKRSQRQNRTPTIEEGSPHYMFPYETLTLWLYSKLGRTRTYV